MDKVLETVIEGLEYTFEKDILVKPLEPVMITKEYEEQIPTGETDEEGFNDGNGIGSIYVNEVKKMLDSI